jgi:hypothetical protein
MQMINYILDSEDLIFIGLFLLKFSLSSLLRYAVCIFSGVELSFFEIELSGNLTRFESELDENICYRIHPGDTL